MAGCWVVIFFGTALAQPSEPGRARWKWWDNPEVRQTLGLSDDQVSRIREVVRARRDVLIDLRRAVEKKGLLLEDEVERQEFDLQKALAAAEEFQKVRRELENARTRLLLEIRGILTLKQFERLKEMRDVAAPRGARGKAGEGRAPSGSVR